MEIPAWANFIFMGLVALGGIFGVSLMANGRKWLKLKIDNEFLEKLALFAFDTVAELGPVVEALKDAASDGKLTKKEIDDLKNMAWEIVKARVGLGELIKFFGSEEEAKNAVNAKVESAVKAHKVLEKK